MKPAARKGRRCIGTILLIVGAGDFVVVEGSWFSPLNSESGSFHSWFSHSAVTGATSAPTHATVEVVPGRARLSLNERMDATLFARPTDRWTLHSRGSHFTSAWLTHQTSVAPSASVSYHSPSFLYSGALANRSVNTLSAPDGGPPPPGLTGHWILNASGSWGTSANWQSGTIP